LGSLLGGGREEKLRREFAHAVPGDVLVQRYIELYQIDCWDKRFVFLPCGPDTVLAVNEMRPVKEERWKVCDSNHLSGIRLSSVVRIQIR
jgi:hypothetical protein